MGTSLVAQMVKNLPAVQETWVQSLGQDTAVDKPDISHHFLKANLSLSQH